MGSITKLKYVNPYDENDEELNPFTTKKFVPDNVIKEFFDLDQAFGAPSKKKKVPTKEEIEAAQKKAAIEALSTKGKPESFFRRQGENEPPNLEQMKFVWSHYP